MNIDERIIFALWVVFVAYWAMSAPSAKRNIDGRRQLWRRIAVRLGIIMVILFAGRVPIVISVIRTAAVRVPGSTLTHMAGIALCAVGIALAIYARTILGRNWGMPMSRKENPELVTGGPYAVIRHPIYTGMLCAMLGTALSTNIVWIVVMIPFGLYFIYSARREEKLMINEFPDQYPVYMKRTRMLLPFVL